MGRKSGPRSRTALAHERLAWSFLDTVVVFGVLVSLGLIAVSVALNYRMGYRSADNAFDGTLYGTGAACGDCLKAIAPFMASWGLRHGDMLAASSAAIVFLVCTTFSFVSAVGFAAEHRSVKHAAAQGGQDAYGDYRREKERLEAKLTFLGQQRSVSEVEGAITVALQQRVWANGPTVGTWTEHCRLDRKQTRSNCETVARLKTERARAIDYADTNIKLGELITQARKSGQTKAIAATDPQVESVQKTLDMLSAVVAKEQIALALALLLALFIEIGSGVGLFIATTPWRNREGAGPITRSSSRLGHVDAFMLDVMVPGEGLADEQQIYAAYIAWCSRRGNVPYKLKEFASRLAALAIDAGLETTFRGQRRHYRNVQLAP